jgi:dipeptidyl aminopeptidase/acylaminoacyl peptidase
MPQGPTLRRPLRGAAAALTLLALAPTARPAEKRAFSLTDLYRLKNVEEPALSPDGRTVVYKVVTSDLAAARRQSNLWRLDLASGRSEPLTFADKTDASPVFAPDGRTVFFLSNRAGDQQVFSMGGGEPQARTDVPGGVSAFVLSADGRRLAVSADVWLSCGADAACNRTKDEERAKSKLKAHLVDGPRLYRHWTEWREAKRSHILVFDLTQPGAAPRDLTPGDFETPVFQVGGPPGFALSPDGQELAFTSNRDPHEAWTTSADVFTVRVDAPAEELVRPRILTGGNRAWDGSPAYSPDGRYLAYRTQTIAGYEADRFRIALYDRRSGETRVLTEDFDNTINDLQWSRDSRKIFFTADVRGRTPLHELEVASGRLRVLTATGLIEAYAVGPDGTWAVLGRRRVAEPLELHRVHFGAKARPDERLTTHNAAVEEEVDIRPAEEISVPGADGKPVQVFIVKPHGFDPAKKYPLILNVHGGPQIQWADAFRGDWQVYPGAGYVVAFPNPHGSTGFGQAYTAAISGDWAGKVMEDIAKVTDALAALPYVDAGRLGLMGWSWGGYAVMWMEAHSDRFKAMASMMGVYDLRSMYSSTEEKWFPHWEMKNAPWEDPSYYRRASPSEHVARFKTPCLVITGEKDYRVPYVQSLMFFDDLQARGVPSRLIAFENAGHWPSWYEMGLYYAAHLDWFHRYLGGAPSPFDPRALAEGAGFKGGS